MFFKRHQKQLDRIILYKAAFGTEEGKKVLYDLMINHHMINPVMVKGDPYDTAFKEGERNVILRIISILKIDPVELLKKIEEGNEQDNRYNQE